LQLGRVVWSWRNAEERLQVMAPFMRNDHDRRAVAAAPTTTPEPTKTPIELRREAEYLDPRRLAANPDGFVG
jgi:hypothetical protein